MATWRYIAQRATTGEFLDFEVPFLTRSELSWSLSAAGALKGTAPAGVATMTAPDGRPLFEEWNTLLYAEADGEIRWGGIVVRSEASDKGWTVEAASFATYPFGTPYLGEYRGVKADPADIVREMWAHIQGFPNSDLGVTVTGSTPLRLGSDSETKAQNAQAAYDAAKKNYEDQRAEYTRLRNLASGRSKARSDAVKQRTAASKALTAAKAIRPKDPAAVAAAQADYNAANAVVNDRTASYNSMDAQADAQAKVRDNAKKAADAAKDVLDKAKEVVSQDGGAYKLLWWEAPDCGDKIKALATSTPFDFTETHAWNADKTAISHRIDIGYPRAGRRRDDLSFIQGDNIGTVPVPTSKGDDFANSIFALGSGEGTKMVHTSTEVADGRLRRVQVLNSKDTKSGSVLRALARDALLKAAAGWAIDQITVRDHTNAPLGSWALGDDIYVQFDVPFLGRMGLWHRVVSWSLTSDSTATLKLERSDSFTYGK